MSARRGRKGMRASLPPTLHGLIEFAYRLHELVSISAIIAHVAIDVNILCANLIILSQKALDRSPNLC